MQRLSRKETATQLTERTAMSLGRTTKELTLAAENTFKMRMLLQSSTTSAHPKPSRATLIFKSRTKTRKRAI